MPTITELKKGQRLPALSLAASGRAPHRQEIADWLGFHRHRVAARFDAYAAGGIDHLRHPQGPRPPLRQHLTATALTLCQKNCVPPTALLASPDARLVS